MLKLRYVFACALWSIHRTLLYHKSVVIPLMHVLLLKFQGMEFADECSKVQRSDFKKKKFNPYAYQVGLFLSVLNKCTIYCNTNSGFTIYAVASFSTCKSPYFDFDKIFTPLVGHPIRWMIESH